VKVLVIVPTYNERENIPQLIDCVLALPLDIGILIVDDNSPDGTGAVVREMARRDSDRIRLIERSGKMGLGSAYVAGFRYALTTEAEYIFEMDADFSHDPAAIPRFLQEMETADVVIGSRYVNGVTVVNWPIARLVLSYAANLYTRFVTGLPLHDATGGYKCFRRSVLESIDLNKVRSDGYAFQIEMNYKSWKRGFRIREIPILFTDRRVGISKMNRRIIWEAIWMVWRLRLWALLGRLV
jgi:dolichol-phosphate mannosyltransferase